MGATNPIKKKFIILIKKKSHAYRPAYIVTVATSTILLPLSTLSVSNTKDRDMESRM